VTKDNIKTRIYDIEKFAKKKDHDAAHEEEDVLYHEFVRFATNDPGQLGQMARLIIKTEKIRFSRW